MPKKKPSVEPSVRRQWLHLTEEEGRTAPEIAKGKGYDVRTVRKAIQWARDERERREARVIVFRQAQQDHYADLVSFADELDSEITRESLISPITKSQRMWKALRQHMPRSPLWKFVDKLEGINTEIRDIHSKLQQKVVKISHKKITPIAEEMGLNREAVEGALIGWSSASYSGESIPLEVRQSRPGYTEITYGIWNCAVARDEKATNVQKYITNLMVEAAALPEAQQLRVLTAKREETKEVIAEELAIIKLKRIVPGRCKYCPL